MSFCLIREKLLSTIVRLQAGEIKREDAIAVSQISQTYINSVKAEVESAKLLHGIGFKLKDVISGVSTLELASPSISIQAGDKVITADGVRTVVNVDDANMRFIGKDGVGIEHVYNFEEIKNKI